VPLDEIPVAGSPFRPGPAIQIVRQPHGIDPAQHGNYAVWVPLTPPVSVLVSVVSPDGARVSITATA
jgi:hypothetical protein